MNKDFMLEAIRLARENVLSGKGGPFGAVVVKDGKIISATANSVTSTNDPTAHAEVNAIREACKVLGTYQLEGCEIYSSCEPCPMCLGAIYWSRPSKLYFAAGKDDAAASGFDDSFIYQEIGEEYAKRQIPAIQICRDEALEAFKIWNTADLKIKY